MPDHVHMLINVPQEMEDRRLDQLEMPEITRA
jgi:REP element-mobilizing transposase RayT